MAKICPSCGARVSDSALTCPHCHASLDATQRISLQNATWCPSCGALVAPGATSCPKCGSSLLSGQPRPRRAQRKLDLPEIGKTGDLSWSDDDATGVMTRIESAIPPAEDASSPAARRDRMPRTRSVALAGLLAVVVVGGAALLITHPWDPAATQTRATTPADTSKSGFPGLIESLTGQDGVRGSQDEQSPQDELHDVWATLGELSDKLDVSEQALRDAVGQRDSSALADGLKEARDLAIDVSNAISQAEAVVGADEDDVEHVSTLGGWLSDRSDALTAAWERAASSDDLATDADAVLAELDDASAYARRFSGSYEMWEPALDEDGS